MGRDAMSAFGEPDDDLSLFSTPPPSFIAPSSSAKRINEVLLLAVTALAIVIAGALASINAGSLWLLGYAVAVIPGVFALGFYRQAVAKRQALTHTLSTRGHVRLQVILGIGLLLVAFVNAIRLAVLWG
jgi:hypothetical protein